MTSRRRVLWACSVVPWLVAAVVWGVVQLAQPPTEPPGDGHGAQATDGSDRRPGEAPQASQVAAAKPDWAAILDRLDRRRERAYASSDPTALRAIYVAGSPVLRHDLAVLRAYQERDVWLEGVRLRALDVRLLERAGPYARLRVVDRLDRATAHTSRGSVRLPTDQATERVIVLRDGAVGWRIAAVRPV